MSSNTSDGEKPEKVTDDLEALSPQAELHVGTHALTVREQLMVQWPNLNASEKRGERL
jgi:hypothetical protein